MQTEKGGQEMDDLGDVEDFMVKQIEYLPVTADCLKQATSRDLRLSKVFLYVQSGWPTSVPDELKPYSDRGV